MKMIYGKTQLSMFDYCPRDGTLLESPAFLPVSQYGFWKCCERCVRDLQLHFIPPEPLDGTNDPSDTVSFAAALALDTDGLKDRALAQSPSHRALMAVAYTGSAALGDAAIDMFIDTFLVGRFFNSRAAGTPNDDDMISVGALGWPAGARLRAVVADAGVTNATYLRYDWAELG